MTGPKITDEKIPEFDIPDTGQRLIFEHRDHAPTGFGIRITKAGGRSFIFQYRFNGKPSRQTIGDWPSWSVSEAIKKVEIMKALLDRGINPANNLEPKLEILEPIRNFPDTDKNKITNMMINEYNDLLDSIQMARERCIELSENIKKETMK